MQIDKITICNRALANLGEPPIQSLDQRGTSAEAMRLRYDEARLLALAGAPWGFATSYAQGVLLNLAPALGYSYAYAYPVGALRVFYIDHPRGTDAPSMRVIDRPDGMGKIILTNEVAPVFVFTRDKEDPTTFDQEFIMALGWLLASMAAMPITKSEKIEQKAFQRWIGLRDVAEANAKSEQNEPDDGLGFYHKARA